MKHIIKNKHWNIPEDYDVNKILYLLIDRFDFKLSYKFYWFDNTNQLYRNYDLPAVIYSDNVYVGWWKNHKRHRNNNKPAIIWNNGYKEYFTNGLIVK